MQPQTIHKLDRIALAKTLGVIDLILHPLFHLWVSVAPESYEHAMNLFVAGLSLEVTHFDTNLSHIVLGTAIEATGFWLLGFVAATMYNAFSHRRQNLA